MAKLVDKDFELAMLRLNDAIARLERMSDRQYTLILVPHTSNESIMISQDGKPLPENLIPPEEALRMAMVARERKLQL